MRIVLFCENKYAIDILNPIQEHVTKQHLPHEILWYIHKPKIDSFPYADQVKWTNSIQEVYDFQPEAIYVPGNIVPYYLPGVKIQVFHGYAAEKKDHWIIRRYFDTYFTQGPYFTSHFEALAKRYGDFEVLETGWSKQDWIKENLHKYDADREKLLRESGKETLILYAPTFSPKLTSLPYIKEELGKLAKERNALVVMKFHPLTRQEWVDEYREWAATKKDVLFIDKGENVTKYQLMADTLISDTSSTIYEFLLLSRPVITLGTISKDIYWENITEPDQLIAAYDHALTDPEAIAKRQWIVDNYDPYLDGNVCQRMLDGAEDYIRRHGVPKNRKLNLWRKYTSIKTFGRIKKDKDMLNFTVGPVMASDEVRAIGAEQVPYFRTAEFSAIMKENEQLMKQFAKASDDARTVFITGSGTASMEAVVMNVFTPADKVLVVNGGSFGHRFVQLCEIHEIPHTEIKLEMGTPLTAEDLKPYEGQGYTGFLVNLHETSTGVLYDIQMISDFCHRNHIFLAVDSISSFLADPFNMKELGVNVMITGSQKALACPPGISVIILDTEAIKRVEANNVKSMYFDLKDALKNGERGQTPFTPAVGTLLQIHARLKEIERNGGVESENQRMKMLAEDFRSKIKDLPFTIVSQSMSNAVTPLHPQNASAYDIFLKLKDEYGIWVCPNGGDMAEKVFRVGHLGNLSPKDNTTLVDALKDMQAKGLL